MFRLKLHKGNVISNCSQCSHVKGPTFMYCDINFNFVLDGTIPLSCPLEDYEIRETLEKDGDN